jgi:tetratricopeptide (TPR) repeat protein
MAAARASAGHVTPDQTTRLWVDAADALERAGRPREAVDVLMQAASLDPEDVTLRRRVAETCAAAGQIDRARAYLSFETAGDHPDLLLALAEHALADGRDGDARRALEQVMAVAPDRRVEAEAMLAPLTREETAPSTADESPADFFTVDVDGPADAAAYGEVTVAAEPGDVLASNDPEPVDDAIYVVADEPLEPALQTTEAFESELEPEVETEPEPETEPEREPEPEAGTQPEPKSVAAVEAAPEPIAAETTPADLDSIAALTAAAQNPALQFQASAQLGRLLLKLGRVPEGIEWLERATQAAATVREQRLDVMYEFAAALERAGEPGRALDVFADLDFDAASFRDVPERMAALRRARGEGRAT